MNDATWNSIMNKIQNQYLKEGYDEGDAHIHALEDMEMIEESQDWAEEY